MKFHENLKRICNDRGTTPTAVLRDMGVATSKIASWNQGNLPKQEMLVRLADFLHCSVMDFFWDESDEARFVSFATNQVEADDEDEEDILRLYRSLSRRDKHEFMAMVYEFEKRIAIIGDNEEAK